MSELNYQNSFEKINILSEECSSLRDDCKRVCKIDTTQNSRVDEAVVEITRMCDDSVKELQDMAAAIRANGKVTAATLDFLRPVKTYLKHFPHPAKPTQQVEEAVNHERALNHRVEDTDVSAMSVVPRFSLLECSLALKNACSRHMQGKDKEEYLGKRGLRAKQAWLLHYARKHPELWFD